MIDHPLDTRLAACGAKLIEIGGMYLAQDFGDPPGEYQAALAGAAIYDARGRGLIELTGQDRAAWLNNLVTNTIKTLPVGQGNYAFATNAKGRILLDFNMLVRPEGIWLDIDRRLAAKALAHFDRYRITEDVKFKDRSAEFVRIALLGPKAAEVVAALGATQVSAIASLSSTTVPLLGKPRLLVRHDFAGVFGVEFYIEAADATACWDGLLEMGASANLQPIGESAVHVLRIEAGIPVYGEDIDEEVLPAETQQIERAVSYVKGCYLGQEVVERMRSRGALARKLVGLRFSTAADVAPGAILKSDDLNVGRLTSVCYSYAVGTTIGLGYLKTSHADPGTKVSIQGVTSIDAEIVSLPFRR